MLWCAVIRLIEPPSFWSTTSDTCWNRSSDIAPVDAFT
jgi:hypothetical protein